MTARPCATRLEDFGTGGIATPQERFDEYKLQCKGLSKRLQARFWLEVIDRDPEVRRMVNSTELKRRRRY